MTVRLEWQPGSVLFFQGELTQPKELFRFIQESVGVLFGAGPAGAVNRGKRSLKSGQRRCAIVQSQYPAFGDQQGDYQ
jgi:hypothetical protein